MKIKFYIYPLLGWLVPGLGHFCLNKYWRGLIFFVSIAAMTGLGLYMGGRIYPLQAENPLTFLAFCADVGNLIVYLLARFLNFGGGDLKRVTFEFGTAYIAGAGLLNYLIFLDCLDIARGKKK